MANTLEEIKAAIESNGFAIVRGVGLATFENICVQLGHILYKTDIRLDSTKSNVVYNPKEILFHTDYPKAQIIGWICIESNDNEAPIELLDTENFSCFDGIRLDVLKDVEVIFKCKLTSLQYRVPLIVNYENKIGTTYNPWGIQEPKEISEVDDFYGYLQSCLQYSVDLNPNDALFIDNYRLLHGRQMISTQSSRHLIRNFIEKYPLDTITNLEVVCP